MKTLQDAWEWYESARTNLKRMQRLAGKHWVTLESPSLFADDEFKQIIPAQVAEESSRALQPLDDLAILVLFSVFEAAVRDFLEAVIQPEADKLVDPILRQAAEMAIEGVRQGSFSLRVLTPLKEQGKIQPELAEMVRQIRDYRNWVAHGKRDLRKNSVNVPDPKEAFVRLKAFLNVLGIATESEEREGGESSERLV